MRRGPMFLILVLALIWVGEGPGSGGWVQAQQNKISLEIKGMDILDVLKLLSAETGMSIVAGRNVAGRVTVFLKEVDPMDALEIILAANGLAYEERAGILQVMTEADYSRLHGGTFGDRRVLKTIPIHHVKPAQIKVALDQLKSTIGRVVVDEGFRTIVILDTPETIERMEQTIAALDIQLDTEIFELNYAVSEDILSKVQEMLSPTVGEARIDERTNKLVVRDYPTVLGRIAKMVQAFDDRPRQVLIEAVIVQVTLSDTTKLGIDWDALISEKAILEGAFPLVTAAGKLTVATASLSDKGDYSVIIDALSTLGESKILSSPKLTVLNNQEAKILVGTKEAFVTTTTSQSGSGTAVTAEEVNFIDVGVKLFVTPTINRDGVISMKIRPEISSKTSTLTTSQGNQIPIIETSEAETTVQVKDGHTVIIGGLMKDEVSQDRVGIPFLSKIPLVGALFRSSTDTVKQTELVILLTPRVYSDEYLPTQIKYLEDLKSLEDLDF